MKSLLTSLFLILFSLSFSQEFNGTIKMKITAIGEGADQYAAFMPTGYTYHMLNHDVLFKIEGGFMGSMMGDVLYKHEEDQVYFIKHAERVANKLEEGDDDIDDGKEDPMPVIEKLDEIKEIAGYTCTKYNVTLDPGTDEESTIVVWATEEISIDGIKSDHANGGMIHIPGIPGVVLRSEIPNEMDGKEIIMVNEVTSIDFNAPDASLFVIPEGYEIKTFSFQDMFMMPGGDR